MRNHPPAFLDSGSFGYLVRIPPIWRCAFRRIIISIALVVASTAAYAQTSQFLFDDNGNLTAQTGDFTGPPQIIGQPQNQIVAPGEVATFSIIAANPRQLSYQWRFNGVDIGGATNDALLLQNVSTNNEGEYRVVLTNPSSSVTSAPALLMIDSDADGVPDSWERTYFTNLNQNATADFDHDGVSNLQEFLDGTNPTNSASALFRITVLRDGGSVVKVPDQPTYTNGQTVTLSATASSNETFHAWLGDVVTRNNTISLVMTNNKAVYARFTPIVFIWTSVVNGDWTNAFNWTPGLVPGSNDSVVITSGATVTLNTPADCADVTLGTSTTSGQTLTGTGTLTVRGNFSWLSGTMSGNGRTVLEPGATLSLGGGGISLTTRTLENGGTALWSGSGGIAMSGGAVLTNRAGALFLAFSSENLGGGIGRFDNAGTFRESVNAGTVTVLGGVSFNNSGAVEIQSGTLALLGGGTHSGSFDVSDGAALNFSNGTHMTDASSTIAGAGQFTISGGTANLAGLVNVSGSNIFSSGTANLTGNYVCTNNTLTISGGTANLNGTGLISPSVVNLSNGTLGGSNVVTVGSKMLWTGGSMSGSGRTVITPGATLNLNNSIPGSPSLNGRTLENGGTVFFTGTGILGVGGGVITNRPGAVFNFENEQPFGLGGAIANGRFDNAGTLRKSAGTGTSVVANGMAFNNSGTVEIQTGALSLLGGGTHSGSFDVPGSTALTLNGTHTANASSAIAGAGRLTVSGGTATLAGLVNLSGSNTFSSGTANLTGNYICTNNALTISGGTANFNGTGPVSPAVLNFSGGALAGSNLVTVGSGMNWTAGTMSGSGRTIISPSATLTIPTTIGVALANRTLENGGSALFSGTSFFSVTGGAVVTNRAGAFFNIENESAIGFGGGIANGRFDNAGTFRKSTGTGTSTVVSGMGFNNSGSVEIQTGTLSLQGGGTHIGSFSVSGGTTLTLSGTHTANPGSAIAGAGQLTVSGGTANLAGLVNVSGSNIFSSGTANLNGNYICTNNSLTISGGTVNFNGTGLISPSVVNLSNGTLGGSNLVTVLSVMNWSGGTMSGSGRTLIPVAATLNIASPSGVILNTRSLENGGTVLWTGAGSIALNLGAVVTNRLGALFHAQNAASLVANVGAGRIDNVGTFRKSISTGTTTVGSGVGFTNFGTVDIRNGKLAANGGYGSASNALLNCALGGTTAGTNYGQLQVAGTVTLNGGLSVDLLPGFTPATNDSFTVVTAGTRSGTFASFSYPSNRVSMLLSNSTTSVLLRVTDVLPIPQPVLLTPRLVGSNALLNWTATSNVTYRLEFNPALTDLSNWTALPGDVTTVSNTASKLDSLTPSNRFYRVRVLP